jgi:hypothetical protein
MNGSLTRRRIVPLALVGAAAMSAPVANMMFAQSSNLVVLGVRAGPLMGTDDADVSATTTEVGTTSRAAPTVGAAVGLLVQSLDVATGRIQVVATPQTLPDGTALLRTDESLTGFTILADATMVVAISPVTTSQKGGNPTRLTFLSAPAKSIDVSGLLKGEQLEGVIGTKDGGLLGLVMRKDGRSPSKLVDIDPRTGAISLANRLRLPATARFRALEQCPDGTLYTTSVERQGETDLVRLDLTQRAPGTSVRLHANGTDWDNGMQSLACTAAGQLLAFGARRYAFPRALYTVDVASGAMTLLRAFDVAQITIA